MPKRGSRKRFVNPFNTQYGWRTGIDTTAGKSIRRDADGFEDFRDYLSESEAETTSELSRLEDAYKMKENRQGHLHRSKVTVKGPSLSQPCAHSTAYSSMCSQTSRGRTLSQIPGDTLGISSITNSQVSDNNALGWLWNRNIGRRTGRDVTEGKVIRVDEKGYEIFEDFLSESEPDSLSSSGMASRLSRTSVNFTREPSKLTEDHTDYGDESTDAEESNSVEVSRSQLAGEIILKDENTQTEDTPTYTHAQSTDRPTYTHTQSTDRPTYTHTQSTDTPTYTHTQSTDTPAYTHTRSTDTSTYTHTRSTDTPAYTHTQSTDTPAYTHTQSTDTPVCTHTQSTDTPAYTHTQPTVADSGNVTVEERTPRADKSAHTDASVQETEQSCNETPTQSQDRSNSRVSTQKVNSQSRGKMSRGKLTPVNNLQTEEEFNRETQTQNTLDCSGPGDEVTKASHMDIGGNKTGSITKTEDLSNSVVPSFRTRKRISFLAAELEATRRASKEQFVEKAEELNTVKDTENKMKNNIAEVQDSDTESIEIIAMDDQEIGQKSNPRKSYQRKSMPAAIKCTQSKPQEKSAKAKGQGQRRSVLLKNENLTEMGSTRGKHGKSLTPFVPAEMSQYDSHEKQMSRKSRSMCGERPEHQNSPETSSQLSGNKLGDYHRPEQQDGDDTASSFIQEFLFFTRQRTEQNHKSVNRKTQETIRNKSFQRKLSKDTKISIDDSIDPNDEIEKWKKGKPKVGGKRKKKSEISEEKEKYVEVTGEPQSHSPAKQSKGNKSLHKTSRERKMSSEGSQKSHHLRSKNKKENCELPLADVNTCDDEVLSEIEASELVIEGEEVTDSPKPAGKRKSSVTKESIKKVSKKSRKSQSVTAQHSLEDSRTVDNEQADLQQVDNFSEEERDPVFKNDKTTTRGSMVTDQSGGCESTSEAVQGTPKGRRKSRTQQKSRKSSTGVSHVSEEEEKTEMVKPRQNASAHTSRFINSFLSEDHERQEVDTGTKNKASKSKSTNKTRKFKSKNDSMQRKIDSAQKCSKFQNKTFTGTSEGKSAKEERCGLVGGRMGRKSTRSLHSDVIGSIEKLQGTTTGLEKPEDFTSSVEKDADPNDLYTEKEKVTSTRSKRKGQKRSFQQEEVKKRDRSIRSTKRKASEENGVVNSNLEEEDAEGIQGQTDIVSEHAGSNTNKSENLSARNSRRQRRVESLDLRLVPNEMNKRRGDNSVRSVRSKSLGSRNVGEGLEAVADDAEIEEEDVNNGTVKDAPGKTCDQDEDKQDDVSRTENHCLTPVSLYQGDEDLLKSGVSFRHRNRQSIKNSTMNYTSSGRSPVTLTKHMNLMNSSAPGLTPILKQPGSAKLGKRRRVTINHLVQEEIYQVPNASGENQNLSTNAGSLTSFSMNATPIHIFQTTTSESPVPQVLMPPQPKIFLPEDGPDGLRRSRRVRCQPVAWYKGERLVYERRKSGLGIKKVEPSHVEMLMLAQEAKRKRNLMKRRNRIRKGTKVTPSPRRNLSVHTTLDPDLQDTSDEEVPVLDPSINEEVLMECFSSKDSEVFVGPSKHEPLSSDPYVMSLRLNQRQFMLGNLSLRPLKSKPKQIVNEGTMAFCLLKGKISVTIHRSKMIAEAGDMFFIPQGNTYSMDNLRKEEARLSFSCFKFTDVDHNAVID